MDLRRAPSLQGLRRDTQPVPTARIQPTPASPSGRLRKTDVGGAGGHARHKARINSLGRAYLSPVVDQDRGAVCFRGEREETSPER